MAMMLPAAAGGEETLWCRTLGVEDGLSQNFVTALAQDRDGFLWFGTASGLNRWNGYEFEVYQHGFDEPGTLSDSTILALHPDREGRLWVGTKAGLDGFEPGSNAVRRYGQAFRNLPGGGPAFVEGITSDSAGRIWFASFRDSRLFRLDPRTNRGTEHRVEGISGAWPTALRVDGADRLWVAMQADDQDAAPRAARYRVFVFDGAGVLGDGDLASPREPFRPEDSGGRISTILEDKGQKLWFGRNGGGLLRWDPRTGGVDRLKIDVTRPDALASGIVASICLSPEGELWVLTLPASRKSAEDREGLHRVDSETLAVHRVLVRQSTVRPGLDATVERLLMDRSGVLWMGSNAGGLRYADVNSAGFELYRAALPGGAGLDSSFVRAICRTQDGAVWVGTPRGLNRIDRAQRPMAFSSPSAEGWLPLPNPNVQAIHEDGRGNLWVGTGEGMVVWEPPSGRVRTYRKDENHANGLVDDYILSIHEDGDGGLWFGTLGGGLHRFDSKANGFVHYPDDPADPRGLASRTVPALFSDSRGRLWVGTAAGLARLESPGDPERGFRQVAEDTTALGGTTVVSIGESAAAPEVLWIGTIQRGLCRLDVRAEECRFYTSRNSDLPDDTIYGILADNRGRLWVSTNRGLARYDPTSDTFRTYGTQHGLQSLEFNGRACFRAPDGEMFFGGVGGLNSFHPGRIGANTHAPGVLVTRAQVLDRRAQGPEAATTLIYRHGMSRREAEIPYRQRDVLLDFVALHYTEPGLNRCWYRLDPYDREWRGPVSQRQARYTNLDPGRYRFRVKAVSSHGVVSAGEAAFSLVVLPPFYATAWFRGLAAAAVLSGLAGGHRWRTRALRRRQRELERQVAERSQELRRSLATVQEQARKLQELDAAKSKFFTHISHEFRTPLMLTLNPLHDVQSGLHGTIPPEAGAEIDLAIRSAGRQLELVDQLLLLARLDAGQLEFRPRDVCLGEFLRRTVPPYAAQARRQGIAFDVELPDVPVRGAFDEEKLEQVVANLLSNALKFTPAGGSVGVRLAVTPDGWATLVVQDTGPGIAPQDLPRVFDRFYRAENDGPVKVPGTGIGLAVARECVELHRGEIRVENRREGGSCFVVRLKIATGVGTTRALEARDGVP